LLSKLSGNGSFKSGDHKKRKITVDSEVTPDTTEVSAEVVANVAKGAGAEVAFAPSAETPVPSRCQECHHHQYYSGGELRTSDGELVNTSKRTPDSYTHYCLGVPSGFRKLKHASNWSGGETPPKWCPLAVQVNNANGENGSAVAGMREVAI